MMEIPVESALKNEDNNNAVTVPEKMKAIPFLKASEKTDTLAILDWPTPKIAANEVLIKVRAFGLNFADIMARKGQYKDAPPFPSVVGYEVSGDIIQVGSECKDLHIGQKVIGFTDFGGYAQYAKARKEVIIPLPESWTYPQGAAISVTFATAYHALFHTGVVLPGSKILIHAAAGGVGLALVELATHAKLEIFGTCGSDDKVKLLQDKGVHHPINYRKLDFETEVKRITEGEGVDIIVDSVGGNYFKKDFNLLAANGRVVGIGASSTVDRSFGNLFSVIPGVLSMLTLSSIDLMMNSRAFYGVNMKRVGDKKPELLAHCLHQVMKLFEEGALNIKQLDILEMDWNQVAEAHNMLEYRKTVGKVVLTIPTDA